MADVGLPVQQRKCDQPVVGSAAVADQPPREHFDCPQIVVAAGDATPLCPQFRQLVLDSVGGDVVDAFKLAGGGQIPNPLDGQIDVFGSGPFVDEVPAKILKMGGQRSPPVQFKRVFQAGCGALLLRHQGVEHHLGRRFIRCQRHPSFDAVLVAVAAPPLLGFRRRLLAGFGIDHNHRLLIQACHYSLLLWMGASGDLTLPRFGDDLKQSFAERRDDTR
ncbi:MAG: hypothetical protein ACKVP0_10295 [Pirellulaceae bacterium]